MEPPMTLGAGGTDESDLADVEQPSTSGEGRVLDKKEAFAQYKSNEGAAINERLIRSKKALKMAGLLRSQCAAKVNQSKLAIDALKIKQEAKKVERLARGVQAEEAEIIDEEEYGNRAFKFPADHPLVRTMLLTCSFDG